MLDYYIVQADGTRVPSDGAGLGTDVVVLTGATTFRVEDAGKAFSLKGATDGAELLLPAIGSGFNCRIFVGSAFATTDWTLVAAADVIQGGAIINSVFVPASNENTISFVASAETVGDYIDIKDDGTNYYASGVGALAGSITFTAP